MECENITFKITAPKIKQLGMNLTKEVKDLSTENYKTLIKENEDNSKKGKKSLAFGLEELILLK